MRVEVCHRLQGKDMRRFAAAALVCGLVTAGSAKMQTTPLHDWTLIDVGVSGSGEAALYLIDRGSIQDAGNDQVTVEMAMVAQAFAARGTVEYDCAGKRWHGLHSTLENAAGKQEYGAEPWADVAGPSAPSRMLDFACARGTAPGQRSLGAGDPVKSGRELLARSEVKQNSSPP